MALDARSAHRHTAAPVVWCFTVLFLACSGSDSPEPACIEDALGAICATDESVTLIDRDHLRTVPRIRLGPDEHRWSVGSNALTGDALLAISDARGIACDSHDVGFAVLERRPPGVLLLSSRDGATRGWYGGRGDGPEEFGRLESVWPVDACHVGVYDQPKHRVTWITIGRGVDSTQVLTFPQGFSLWHRIVGAPFDGRLVGFGLVSPPLIPEPVDIGLHPATYRVGRYDYGSLGLEVMRDVPGMVQFLAYGRNLGQAPYRPDTQVWADSEHLWLANGHWPLLHSIDAEGEPGKAIWLDLEREPVSAADRERFIEDHARRGGDDPNVISMRRALAANFEFPEMKPYYHEARPMGEDVWVRVSDEPRGWGSTWLIVDVFAATAKVLATLPVRTRPLARSGDTVLLEHVDSLGVVELRAFNLMAGPAGS